MKTNQHPAPDLKEGHDEHHDQNNCHSITYDTYDSTYYMLYFIGRYLVVTTSYFLCIIASLYASGSLVTLEATNFFCPSYTLEEIRQYNLVNGNKYGTKHDSCLRIDRQGLNLNVLSDLNYNIFTGKIDNDSLDFVQYLQAILYFVTTLILFIPTLYHTYLLVYDTKYAISSVVYHDHAYKNERVQHELFALHKRSQSQPSHQAEQKPTSTISHVFWCYIFTKESYKFCARVCKKCYFEYIRPIYYVDSKWKMLSIIAREWFEILIQIYALLLYGGINIFDLKSNVLSQSPDIIESFAIIVSVNCVAGMRSCIACVCCLIRGSSVFSAVQTWLCVSCVVCNQ